MDEKITVGFKSQDSKVKLKRPTNTHLSSDAQRQISLFLTKQSPKPPPQQFHLAQKA